MVLELLTLDFVTKLPMGKRVEPQKAHYKKRCREFHLVTAVNWEVSVRGCQSDFWLICASNNFGSEWGKARLKEPKKETRRVKSPCKAQDD